MLVNDTTHIIHITEMLSTVIKDSLLHSCPQQYELLETSVYTTASSNAIAVIY